MSPDHGSHGQVLLRANAIRNAASPARSGQTDVFLFTHEPLDNFCQRCVTLGGGRERERYGNLVSRFESGKTQKVSALSDTGRQSTRTNEGESAVIVAVWHFPQRLIRNSLPPSTALLIFPQLSTLQLSCNSGQKTTFHNNH